MDHKQENLFSSLDDSPGVRTSFSNKTDEQSVAGSCNQKYYGVSLPESMKVEEPLVFSSKLDAINSLKKYPQARFKEFEKYEQAVAYASSVLTSFSSGTDALASLDEKEIAFKSVSSQNLVNLRKQIESGNETTFYDLVWSNPRYLVNSNDCPTTLQSGTHSNALHIAARYGQTVLCIAVLNTLHDLRFMKLLYPDEGDNPLMLEAKRKRIMDLYLNTADKSLGETPLHFASKFGSSEIVKVLLSYECCERDKRNKYDMCPVDMICDRASSHIRSEDLKFEIRSMFEYSCCIPILRDVNNNAEPTFGEPCASSVKEEVVVRSRFKAEKNLLPCAFAGPMTSSDANHFYLACKKKKFSKYLHCSTEDENELKEICLSDPIKGLERIGRKIAKDFKCHWIEFWPILCTWADLSSDLGLDLLESHLKCRTELKLMLDLEQMSALNMEQKCDALTTLIEKGLVHNSCNIAYKVIDEKKNTHFFQLFQSLMPETICMTNYSFSNSKFLKHIHEEIAYIIYLKLAHTYSSQGNIHSVLHEFIMQLNAKLDLTSIDGESSLVSKNWNFLICIIRFLIFVHHGHQTLSVTPCIPLAIKPICVCDWIYESDYIFDSSVLYCKILKIRQNLHHTIFPEERWSKEEVEQGDIIGSSCPSDLSSTIDLKPYFEHKELERSMKEFSGDEFNTSELSDDEFYTPPESPINVSTTQFNSRTPYTYTYFSTSEISDDDIDIYRAIEKVSKINCVLHPNLSKWKSMMESKLEKFLRPATELNRTPASASATLKRRLTEKDGKPRRLLF